MFRSLTMPRNLTILSVVVSVCWGIHAAQADWRRFRGPNGSGVSEEATSTPTQWSPAENLQWKVKLPGKGVSSPIVVGDRVFVTCYSGYGLERGNPGDIENLKRHLICVDRNSGDVLWQKAVKAVQPEDPYAGAGVPSHGYASHTPVSDGERVYVFFGKTGVLAFDMDGKQLWQTSVGTGSDNRRWGSSSSPIVHDDLVIVTASAESRALVGLNRETGSEVWRQETDGLTDVWGTPLVSQGPDGRADIVIGVPYEFWGLNPETGKLRWYCDALNTDQFSTSVVESDGVIFGMAGRGGGSIAVQGGGKGDVSDSNIVWDSNESARFGTPLVYDGRMYNFTTSVVNCLNAKDGSPLYEGRLPSVSNRGDSGGEGGQRGGGNRRFGGGGFGGSEYSSPVAADGKIYYVKGDGTTIVIRAGDEFELIGSNQVTTDRESFAASPAISDGQIFLRSDQHLYCVGQ